MSEFIPDALLKEQRAAQKSIDDARHNLRQMLDGPEGTSRFNSESVSALFQCAVVQPDAAKLADLLCALVPSQFNQTLAANGGQDNPRMLKMRSAILEAGLEEQLRADRSFRQGSAFDAQLLEATLDDWLRAGRHRGAAFDEVPLSKIDTLIASTVTAPEDCLRTRMGLLVPLVVNIHIWRALQALAPADAEKIGWCLDIESGDHPVSRH